MPSHREDRARTAWRALIAGAAAFLVVLVASGSAVADQDQLKGGTVTMQLAGSHGLKLRPSSVTLPITGGAFDPIDGSGTVRVSGGFNARLAKAKAKIKVVSLTFGAHGGPGSIAARVGKTKKAVAGFGALSGGTLTRVSWGARIQGVTASIAGKGAQALNRAFSGKGGKGARKSSGRGVKPGQPLGTVTATTDPLSVAVVPGTGTLQLNTNLSGAFANKLPQHCISVTGGVTAVPPGMMLLFPVGAFSFPVSGGSAAPDFTAGEVDSAGGQTLTKDNGPFTASGCSAAQPPVGTKLVSTDLGVDFQGNLLMSTAALPTGASLRAALADLDFSTASRSVDPNTKTLNVTGATVRLSDPAALTLNTFFPTQSGNPADDFAPGDEIGTLDLTGVKLR